MIPGSVDPGVLALVYVSLHLGNSFAAIHDGLTSNTMQADIGYSYHEFGSYSSIIFCRRIVYMAHTTRAYREAWPGCRRVAVLLYIG